MKLLIKQPFGLGDIIFCAPLVNLFNKEHEYIWKVDDQFLWLKNYIQFDENVKLVSSSDNTKTEGVINLQDAQKTFGGDCMSAKYRMFNLDFNLWKTLKFNVNLQKCNNLAKHLKLNIHNSDYMVVNYNFANPLLKYKYSGNFDINRKNIKIVHMDYIEGYTMFDWYLVLKYAKEIHTVSTANFYLISLIDTIGDCHLYPRIPLETNLDPIRPIITSKWKLHE